MSNRLCFDFCCGLKGFSSAFLEDGYEVISVDIEPKFNPTICKDILKLTISDINKVINKKHLKNYDLIVVLASPPCERFSIAPTIWPIHGIGKSLSIVGAILELIIKIKPKYWCLENPSTGYLRWFIGEPNTKIRLNAFGYKTVKPTGLWGNLHIPFGLVPDSAKKNTLPDAFANHHSRNPSKRALLPHGLSKTILSSVKINLLNKISDSN